MRYTVTAVIRPGEQSGYVAECVEIAVTTQGETLDQTASNLRDAVALHLDGEDLQALGFGANPAIIFTCEMEPVHALERATE